MAQVLDAGLDADRQGLIIKASHSVLYAGTADEGARFEEASRQAAVALWREVNAMRDSPRLICSAVWRVAFSGSARVFGHAQAVEHASGMAVESAHGGGDAVVPALIRPMAKRRRRVVLTGPWPVRMRSRSSSKALSRMSCTDSTFQCPRLSSSSRRGSAVSGEWLATPKASSTEVLPDFFPVAVRSAAAHAAEAARAPDARPVRGAARRAAVARRVDERLQQQQRMPEARRPGAGQAPLAQRQHPRAQVRRTRARQDQEPACSRPGAAGRAGCGSPSRSSGRARRTSAPAPRNASHSPRRCATCHSVSPIFGSAPRKWCAAISFRQRPSSRPPPARPTPRAAPQPPPHPFELRPFPHAFGADVQLSCQPVVCVRLPTVDKSALPSQPSRQRNCQGVANGPWACVNLPGRLTPFGDRRTAG